MGTLLYVNGNLFGTDKKVIGHGVNCKGGFGSGVAGQIAKRFPDVKRAYLRKHEREGWRPGEVQFVLTTGGIIIANMATQRTYGKTGTHVIYDAVRQCFQTVLRYCESDGKALAIPKVGAGLAGGSWEIVEGILRECLSKADVEVDVHVIQ